MIYYVLHVVIILFGGILLLRKVADMDGHHGLRVFVLTTIFSLPVILIILAYIHAQLYPSDTVCFGVR